MSYTIPESPTIELSDISYDGKRQDNLLTDGLGRLIDGEVGADNYRLDMGDGRGNRWVDTRRVLSAETEDISVVEIGIWDKLKLYSLILREILRTFLKLLWKLWILTYNIIKKKDTERGSVLNLFDINTF